MKKTYWYLIVSILIIISTLSITFAITQQYSHHNNNDLIPNYYRNSGSTPPLPSRLQFANEEVPLDVYYVREALDKELIINCYQHSKTLQIIKRSGRFFPVIEPILKEEGVPEDFKYLCVAESALDNVVSPAKAAGFWQFLPTTAKNYGLEVRDEVDERYHLEKATRAACKYLKNSYNKYNSWALAAAAYNMGDGNVNICSSKQECSSYWDLNMNSETARYVYRILAYKLIMDNPRIYGYDYCEAQLYHPIPYKEVVVTSSIPDLYVFARDQDCSYKELKMLNPWLRSSKLTISDGSSYTIRIPNVNRESYFNLYRNIANPYTVVGDTVFHY